MHVVLTDSGGVAGVALVVTQCFCSFLSSVYDLYFRFTRCNTVEKEDGGFEGGDSNEKQTRGRKVVGNGIRRTDGACTDNGR